MEAFCRKGGCLGQDMDRSTGTEHRAHTSQSLRFDVAYFENVRKKKRLAFNNKKIAKNTGAFATFLLLAGVQICSENSKFN